MKQHTCPVCFFPAMDAPPCDYNICSCCGTEFGADDVSYAALRHRWVRAGAPWFYGTPPPGWSWELQLAEVLT